MNKMNSLIAVSIEKQIEIIKERTKEKFGENDHTYNRLKRYLETIGYDTLIYKNEEFIFKDVKNREIKTGLESRNIINIYKIISKLTIKFSEFIFELEELLKSSLKIAIAKELEKNKTSLKILKKDWNKNVLSKQKNKIFDFSKKNVKMAKD